MTEEDAGAARARSLVHGQVCYLQLPAANRDRAAAFYEAVFGWQIEAHHPDFAAPGLIGRHPCRTRERRLEHGHAGRAS